MNKLRTYFFRLNATDFIVVIFALILIGLNIIYFERIDGWLRLVALDLVLILFVLTVAYLDEKHCTVFWTQLHYWYLVPLIFLLFKELHIMINPIRHMDVDNVLIHIDRFIFGTDPTHVLYKIANPVLTEILQIVYGSFFFLPVILGVNLILCNRINDFKFATFMIVYGFMLSYFGYILFPAIGPRFTLHVFANTNKELPGLFLTNFLREIVNSGESIPFGTPNPMAVVQRDAFPSGHTQITLLVMYLSVRFRTPTRYFFLVVGTLLIFSTVYLRYHYVVDLIGGLIFMILTIWSGYYLYNWWMKTTNGETFDYPKN